MGTSVLHIKTEVECKVFLFDEEKGIATPGKYFNLEVRKGEQDLMFVSTSEERLRHGLFYLIEDDDSDYCLEIKQTQFKNYPIEIFELIRLSEKGDVAAQFKLGLRYYKGEGIKIDRKKAAYWWHTAAKQGDSSAQFNLGYCYNHGEGVNRDLSKAISWYQKALEQGNEKAKKNIELCQKEKDGGGIYGDWYGLQVKNELMSAKRGNPDAQNSLGFSYAFGVGVDSDWGEAVFWWQKAAEQGHISAQNNLGAYYKNGDGLERDLKKAYYWLSKAAEHGDKKAQDNLRSLEAICAKEEGKRCDIPQEPAHEILIKKEPLDKQYYLFFDTETTGVPKDDSAPASDTRNWPRLVQLAWILTDKEWNTLASSCSIIKPEGFTIPDNVAKIHGINTYKAMREGKPLKNVIDDFLKAAEKARCLVGHNVVFDQKIVGAELCRLGIKDTISTAKAICTMEASKEFCKIPGGYYGYKPPKLQELYQKLFGTTFDNAHDAMADVKATKRCFFELKRLEVPELLIQEGLALLN